MKLFAKLAATAALLTAAQANALVIDFGATPWTPSANNQLSYTVNYALTGDVTATAGPTGTLLFANDAADGLGVASGELDEIEGAEHLKITFENASSITSIKLTDLFQRNHPSDNLPTDGNDVVNGEVATIYFYLNSILVNTSTAYGLNSSGSNGEQTFAVGGIFADALVFVAGGEYNEYSVKSIEVPEPGLLGLLGLGMLCLGLSRRRQAKAA